MNAYSALVVVCGVCFGSALATTMAGLVLPNANVETVQIESRKSMTLPVIGTVNHVLPGSFLLTEDSDSGEQGKVLKIRYDKDTIMLVRTLVGDPQGIINDSKLAQTTQAGALTEGRRIRATLWLSAENTIPYAMMIFISPTQ